MIWHTTYTYIAVYQHNQAKGSYCSYYLFEVEITHRESMESYMYWFVNKRKNSSASLIAQLDICSQYNITSPGLYVVTLRYICFIPFWWSLNSNYFNTYMHMPCIKVLRWIHDRAARTQGYIRNRTKADIVHLWLSIATFFLMCVITPECYNGSIIRTQWNTLFN